MAAFTISELTFTYPGRREPALNNINLEISKGEFLVVCGQSGSGKTTLLRNLKPMLTPYGSRSGSIQYDGRELDNLNHREQAALIGYVLQNPDNQIVTDKVWHELAFGLESLGVDQETIRLRVAEMASFFGIEKWFHREISTLSGGQKQLLNLAAVMVMQPQVLILDEPVSQLDPLAASDFIDTVIRINREFGTTIIITEHRLDEVVAAADRVVVMDGGSIITCNDPSKVCCDLHKINHPMFKSMPVPAQIAVTCEEYNSGGNENPLNVRDGRKWINNVLQSKKIKKKSLPRPEPINRRMAVEMKNIWFAYERGEDVIRGLDLRVYSGEILAVLGGNGTGKTTLMRMLSGIRKPQRGKIVNSLKTSMLPQNPQALFTEETVYRELEVMKCKGTDVTITEDEIVRVAELVEISHLLESHPYDLSGGEQQRAALAKVLLTNPQLLILDEPTKGMDNSFKLKLGAILRKLQDDGMTIVMVSHDIEFCSSNVDRCVMLFDGITVAEGIPEDFFAGNSFYTTAANRMSRHVFDKAVTAEHVIKLIELNMNDSNLGSGGGNGENDSGGEVNHNEEKSIHMKKIEECSSENREKCSGKCPIWCVETIVFGLAVATILIGYFALDNQYYIGVCLLVIFCAMVPFFWRFEKRNPKAREIVILVVLVTAAVVGRGAFFAIPNFKPMLAIVIIAGVAMGREDGFLAGAMASFVSNFLFGQGPWTPWQMIAAAVVGYLAGLLFYKNSDKVSRISLIVFGAIAAMVLYGGIVDIWTILVISEEPTIATIVGVYGAAVYFNIVHGLATAVFLFILAKPMLSGINRVKYKYGM